MTRIFPYKGKLFFSREKMSQVKLVFWRILLTCLAVFASNFLIIRSLRSTQTEPF